MKKGLWVFIFALMITTSSWGGDKIGYNASSIAVDSIINYYSAMANSQETNQPVISDLQDRLAYFNKNRELLISQVARTGTFTRLDHALQTCDHLYQNSTKHLGYGKSETRVNQKAYFDTLTGHKYIKAAADSYLEYSKEGEYLKTVSSDLPLLNKSRNIHPVTRDSYLYYTRISQGEMVTLALPGLDPHPKGWKTSKIFIALN